MTKKRVYELAKELGIENKELIAHMTKLGITVKSHSSTLEDIEVEKITRILRAEEPHEVVEKRIKSTVIRRRAVLAPVEEPQEPAEEEKKPSAGDGEPQAPPRSRETPPPRRPAEAQTESGEKEGKAEAEAAKKEDIPRKDETVKAAQHAIEAAPEKVRVITKETKGVAAPEEIQPPAVDMHKEELQISETQPDRKKVDTQVQKVPVPAPAASRPVQDSAGYVKEAPKKPAQIMPPPQKESPQKDVLVKAEDDKSRKKRPPVEVLMEEVSPVKKKAFIKKVVEKKIRHDDVDIDEKPSRWREIRKPAVVKMQKTAITVPKAVKRRIKVGEAISVGELSKKMGVKAGEVINKLIALGMMVTINQTIDIDAATIIATEFGYQVEHASIDYDEEIQKVEAPPEKLKSRAPVVTVMGHVDHGKTSLLDAIRETNVIGGEAGGITQAIGAYHVHIKDRDIVFLDTPGHEAFTAMRARGAKVTDIVVLVVAADDGVMDQTVEAIDHSRIAGVPIIVAINKIDKQGADPGKIKQALTEYNLLSEEWGGDTIFCEISAKKKQGIEDLLEMILLQADMMDLKADPDRLARGVVIEAQLDRGRGPVATILIQEGTLHEGDAFVSKTEYGRVRAMIDDQGGRVKNAGPSMPVEVIGFSKVPQVGTEFICLEDEKKARVIAGHWIRKEREKELSAFSKITLDQLYQKIKEGIKDFNVIVKADVQGSIEALVDALNKLSTSDVRLKIIHSSTGAVTETDVMLASASNAIIIGFNVRPDSRVTDLAEHEGVEIKLYDIIYNVISDMKAAMDGLLEPVYREVTQGRAEVRKLFKIPKIGTIAGSYVLDGKITRNAQLKLVRDGVVVYDGKILSLKRLKDDAKEVLTGFECGIGIEGYNDLHVGDIIESYVQEAVERKLQ